jgi:hypothetical protein
VESVNFDRAAGCPGAMRAPRARAPPIPLARRQFRPVDAGLTRVQPTDAARPG